MASRSCSRAERDTTHPIQSNPTIHATSQCISEHTLSHSQPRREQQRRQRGSSGRSLAAVAANSIGNVVERCNRGTQGQLVSRTRIEHEQRASDEAFLLRLYERESASQRAGSEASHENDETRITYSYAARRPAPARSPSLSRSSSGWRRCRKILRVA